MTELHQKTFLEERRFKLTEAGLEMYCNDTNVETTSFWTYDEFSGKSRIFTEKFPKILYIGLFLLLGGYIRTALLIDPVERSALSSAMLCGLGIVLILFYYLYQKPYKLLCLDNDQQVFLMAAQPDEKAVDAFIARFYEMRRIDYRKRYFRINLDNEQQKEIDRMNWLHKEGIISDSELEFMLEEIQIKFL